jgi:hypothetical protein
MLLTLIRTLISVFRLQQALALEYLALRHQVGVLQRTNMDEICRRHRGSYEGCCGRGATLQTAYFARYCG